jgi:hypothetical protein
MTDAYSGAIFERAACSRGEAARLRARLRWGRSVVRREVRRGSILAAETQGAFRVGLVWQEPEEDLGRTLVALDGGQVESGLTG